jgi:predicted ATPase
MHTKGFAAPDTKAALEQARSLIERAEALGEPPEDPLALFSVLYGFWVASCAAFDGEAARELASQFMALAEKQRAIVPLMLAHRIMGRSLLETGRIMDGRAHCDQAIALYDPAAHRPLATRFGQDTRAAVLSFRSWGLWLLGFPEGALADAEYAIEDAREIGQSATLIFALSEAIVTYILCGHYGAASTRAAELVALADEKGAVPWVAAGMSMQGCVSALTGKAANAVQMITSGIATLRSVRTNLRRPLYLSFLGRAYADAGRFDDAWRCIGEAMAVIETTKQTWFEADINRTAGEIALVSPERDAVKAQAFFERALEIACGQQARSWELRAAMSLARLWRDQGKPAEAHDLLAPVYGGFTEGFDTIDLKQAKALLDELAQ